jgi:large repetitive protein
VPNGINGIDILSGATSNTVGGTTAGARDVISGNLFNGVVLGYKGTSSNVIEGDYIGTDFTGAKALPNGGDGVDIIGGATYNTVGGTTPGALDVISGNGNDGVLFTDTNTWENIVEGDYIGTDDTGTKPLGNDNGVVIQSSAFGNLVGGVGASSRDIISGNSDDGVLVSGSGTTVNTIEYDYIGTGITGELPVSNGVAGVVLANGASSSYVYHSVISANGTDGVLVTGTSTSNNQIMFDSIGLDATGLKSVNQSGTSFSNAIGVVISGASGTVVEASFVSGNGTGVLIDSGATGNSIYANDIGTGIDGATNVGNLGDGVVLDGVTNNVVADDLLVYNGDVGILGENGSTSTNNTTYNDTLTIIVNGVTSGNKNGAEKFV